MTDLPGSRIAVAGATGYIGTRLVPRLAAAGYRVRCLVRSPRKLLDRPAFAHPAIDVVPSELDDVDRLRDDLHGCEAAFYLVHAMQSAGRDYAEQDRAMAGRFAAAAAAAGVARVVFLGGLGESGSQLSAHLQSRREVEQLLHAGPVPVTAFRAAMIIGSGSASFEILRYLTERLPVLLTPRWVRTECQPIAVQNVLHYLVACLSVPDTAGRVLEIGGADVASYETLIQIMAEERGLPRRFIIRVPVLTPFLSALWIHLVTPVSARMARPLAEGLRSRVVVSDDTAARLMPQRLLGARESIRAALDAESQSDVESTWSAAGPIAGDPDWAGGDVFEDSRETVIEASADRVFEVLTRLGGRRGWLRYNRLWRLRGLLDRLAGGPGMNRGRRDPARLSWGDTVDFWRVVELEGGRRLTLRAEMRLPGDAVLDFELFPAAGATATRLVQSARFRPRGLTGLLYWYAVLPFHKPVFSGLLEGIREASTNTPSQEEALMRHAIAVARRNRDLPFGVIIVRRGTGDILADGVNRTEESPTLHAEIDAINRCATRHPGIDWRQLDLYATAEPCPMCQGAIEFAGIAKVYYGSSIPWLARQGWWQIDLRAAAIAQRSPTGGATVIGGVLEEECNALFVARDQHPSSRQPADGTPGRDT